MDLNLKLHVYEGRRIVKTYECDVFDVYLGTVEDVAHALRLDKINSGDNAEMFKALVGCIDVIRPFLCDMFDGLTLDEAKHTRIENLVEVFQTLIAWFYGSMNDAVSENKKKSTQ